ncbi:hypothetical protein HBH98_101450 [Parastagonospora nodorum]|nr:hypothetical protein HBH53_058510 [Parastagonospora nodorum]KAH3975625.1 hypothetical protein HBH52_128360 [Parastagonospora nodorum]KAH3978626.1 hypothetical protein HBH51_065290 [Parastagonospora nodorum]KAH4032299.1 hypothetical protein HBI09_117020 [Parastagonospora nodorum]KAH4049442.1 hypothetical protein HBH49_146760 [Parastagonospora nodorum]
MILIFFGTPAGSTYVIVFGIIAFDSFRHKLAQRSMLISLIRSVGSVALISNDDAATVAADVRLPTDPLSISSLTLRQPHLTVTSATPGRDTGRRACEYLHDQGQTLMTRGILVSSRSRFSERSAEFSASSHVEIRK